MCRYQEIRFSAPNSCSLPWLVKGATQYLCTSKRSVINCTWLRLSVSDWSIIMTGPGGLLLVVPTYMQFLVGLPKKKKINWDIQFYYPEWHTEHWWRCSYSHLIVFFTLYYILVYPMQLLPSVHKFHTNHVVKNSSYVI